MLARQLDRRLRLRKPERFRRIELQKIDQFGDIGVSFRPVLRHLENHPRRELMLAFANDLRRAQQQLHALLNRHAAPRLERLQRRIHRGLNFLAAGLLKHADYFRRLRRIDRFDLRAGLDAASADHQVVFAPEFRAYLVDRRAHFPRVLWIAEVGQRLVLERPYFDEFLCRSLSRCHDCCPLAMLNVWAGVRRHALQTCNPAISHLYRWPKYAVGLKRV